MVNGVEGAPPPSPFAAEGTGADGGATAAGPDDADEEAEAEEGVGPPRGASSSAT